MTWLTGMTINLCNHRRNRTYFAPTQYCEVKSLVCATQGYRNFQYLLACGCLGDYLKSSPLPEEVDRFLLRAVDVLECVSAAFLR